MEFFINSMVSNRANSSRIAQAMEQGDGHWFARLVAANPRVVKSFSDHEEVARKLQEAGELQTLVDVASCGMLDGPDSRVYRRAFQQALAA